MGRYAVVLALLVVGLVWAGVPASTLLFAGLVVVCPVMMFVMMRGMHGDASGHDISRDHRHDDTADRIDDPHAARRPGNSRPDRPDPPPWRTL